MIFLYLLFLKMKNLSVNKNSVISRLINNYLLSHKAPPPGLHAWLVQPALDEVLIKNKEMLFLIPIAIILVTLCKG